MDIEMLRSCVAMRTVAAVAFRPDVLRHLSSQLRPIVMVSSSLHPHRSTQTGIPQIRAYSAKPPLTFKTVEDRIMLVLGCYEKIDRAKLKMDSDFIKDLGLDSLDHVEVIMAMEEEFGFEIPDGDADRLKTPRDVFQYVCDKEDVYS